MPLKSIIPNLAIIVLCILFINLSYKVRQEAQMIHALILNQQAASQSALENSDVAWVSSSVYKCYQAGGTSFFAPPEEIIIAKESDPFYCFDKDHTRILLTNN